MKKIINTVLACLCCLIISAQEEKLPVIDMHLHAQDTIFGKNLPCYPDWWEGPDTKIRHISELLPMTVEEMKKNNIVLGIVTQDKLDELYRWKAYAPEMFLTGILILDPLKPDMSLLRKEFTEGRLDIVGEIAAQYHGLAPNDPKLDRYYDLAEEFDVPVLIHCGGLAGESSLFNIKDGNPLLLEEVLKTHPKLRIYIENAGYPFDREIITLMYRYPNVYADLSTFSWIIPRKAFHNYLKTLMDADLGKRLKFGSDQMIWPETISMAVEAIESAEFLSKEQKRDIFYNNAARFLRLSGDEIKAHHEMVGSRDGRGVMNGQIIKETVCN